MRWLETKIPPPIVALLLAVSAFGGARLLPTLSFEFPLASLATAGLGLAGVTLNLLPKAAFRRVGTTVNPLRPALTSQLVTSGIYRHSRNPMYLGYAVILLAWALYLQNAAALLATPLFMLYITWFQILPEERCLSSRFPDTYAAFRRNAPRWL
jgi:protein-S-isoprenylcysteine O-methyltransferase Ste14